MRKEKNELEFADDLVACCKSGNSLVKMNKKFMGIILASCNARDVRDFTDSEGYINKKDLQLGDLIFYSY